MLFLFLPNMMPHILPERQFHGEVSDIYIVNQEKRSDEYVRD